MKLNVGQLKKIIADMPDDADVFARDRDCISLDKVHVVGHPTIHPDPKTGRQLADSGNDRFGFHVKNPGLVHFLPHPELGVIFVPTIKEVSGGEHEDSKQAIIFCDCD
jgi:hypothetical protein